jgi:hypothetical protein
MASLKGFLGFRGEILSLLANHDGVFCALDTGESPS